jgi:flagellar hook-basal body complex protein FliE
MSVSIGALSPIPPIVLTSVGGPAPSAGGADFGSALKQAVGALGQLGAQADASSLSMAQGNPVDLHEVMLNTEQASLGFSMALQVRNKLVDAYAEVMRMSV